MKNVKAAIKLFRYNLLYTVLFECFLKTVSFAVLIPLYYAFVNYAVKLSGISYLSKETVKKFFKAPSTYAFLFVMFLFISMCIMVEVSGISYAYHRAHYLKKTSPLRMLLVGIRSSMRVLRPRNMPIFVTTLCYLPVISNVILVFDLLNIRAPYIIDIVSVNKGITIAVAVLYILVVLYSLRYTFILHVFNVEKVSFRKAVDRTKELLKGKRFKTISGVLAWVFLTVALPAVVNFYYSGSILSLVLSSKSAVKAATLAYESVKIVLSFLYVVAGLPAVYSYICASFYSLLPKEEDKPSLDDYDEVNTKNRRHREGTVIVILTCMAIILNVGFYMLKRYNVISVNVEYLDKVTITAHRGDSSSAPENTLAAFEKAIENGADIIELDVRETKDGEIVVMHDENLKRTCGVNKKVGKLTYEELLEYSPTAKCKGEDKELYKDEKIPTLREAIELVGDRAIINIELKPAKTDKKFVQKVVEIIQEYEYYDNCLVTSLNYGSIKKIKLKDSRIKTVYTMAVAMGDFYSLEYADGFSIKARYINNDVVKQAHSLGKEVYAWTIDDPNTLESMMLMDVDSIITNKPAEMRKAMYENYYSDTLIQRLNEFLSNQI
ncbi:MAG: glycerophosphodiester phosphodiesterase family protein [Eubacterium sp.]|nr:glycerophosphodiester phosphodiesterase family protein [Eubacterium sp.]